MSKRQRLPTDFLVLLVWVALALVIACGRSAKQTNASGDEDDDCSATGCTLTALSDKPIAVGANSHSSGGPGAGADYVFER